MKFTELTFENFRCYAPKETAPLTTRAGRPLISFVGENGAGKTSIFLGVIWVLYGEKAILRYAESRPQDKQAPHNNFDLINREVRVSSPRPFMRVSLRFEHESAKYFLFRSVTAKTSNPRGERDLLPEALSLRIDKSTKDEPDPQGKINDILPFEAFQFFFFDGEDVRRYSGATSGLTRDAIEQVLGIPEVQDARDDFERIQKRLLQRMSQEAGIDDNIRVYTEQLSNTISELQTFTENRSILQKELTTVLSDLASNEVRRDKLKGIAELNDRLRGIKNERDTTAHNLDDAILDRDKLVKDLPYALARPELRKALDRLKKSVGTDDLTQQLSLVNSKLVVLQELLDPKSQHCYCGDPIHAEQKANLKSMQKALERQHDQLETLASRKTTPPIDDVQYVLGRIEGITADFKSHEQKITEFQADLIQYDDSIRNIESRIKGSNIEEAVKVQELIEKLRERKGKLEGDINSLNGLITERDERRERQEGVLNRQQVTKGALSGLPRKRELSAKVTASLQWVVDELVKRKRATIIENASDFFRRVTGDASWNGIRIDDDYSVWLVDSKGSQTLPAEGYKELVALSFIYGLNKAASYNAPVVMDFLLGRLDAKNQLGVAKNLADFADQLIILFLDTEIQSDEVRTTLQSLQTSEFVIQRNSSKGNSSIREVAP